MGRVLSNYDWMAVSLRPNSLSCELHVVFLLAREVKVKAKASMASVCWSLMAETVHLY